MDKIRNLLYLLGIRTTYRGYLYLCYAVSLCLENEDYLLHVWKWLYTDIAQHFGVKRANVEHNLRTAIAACYNRGNKQYLDQIAGYPLSQQPTTGEFISILVHHLKQQENKHSQV